MTCTKMSVLQILILTTSSQQLSTPKVKSLNGSPVEEFIAKSMTVVQSMIVFLLHPTVVKFTQSNNQDHYLVRREEA